MSLAPGADIDVNDILAQHNADGSHKGASNLKKVIVAAGSSAATIILQDRLPHLDLEINGRSVRFQISSSCSHFA